MRLNQRGDALTLAMAASVFVGVSIMIMTTVMSNLLSKSRRARMQNEVDSQLLSIGQLISNRDLCKFAFRNPDGSAARFNATVPQTGTTATFPVGGIFIGGPPPGGQIEFCGTAMLCTRNEIAPITSIIYSVYNTATNNAVVNYRGQNNGQYRLQSGSVRVSFGGMALGGQMAPRTFPIQMIVDVTTVPPGRVEMCYGRESLFALCTQMGGSIDPTTGGCQNMFGMCGTRPQDTPAQCPGPPAVAPTACPAPLFWTNVWYTTGIDPSLQMKCKCSTICTSP